jgi:predicted MFS family arabinose efflux permease
MKHPTEIATDDAANGMRERLVLLTLSAVQFTSIVDFMVIMPLGPQLMRVMAISPGQFALVVSAYTFAAGISGLVTSSLVDRFGRKSAFLVLFAGFFGHIAVRAGAWLSHAGGGAIVDRSLRRRAGRHGDGDHWRRVSG